MIPEKPIDDAFAGDGAGFRTMNVQELRALLADLPDEMPIVAQAVLDEKTVTLGKIDDAFVLQSATGVHVFALVVNAWDQTKVITRDRS